jgi:hypothetical protein
MVRSPLLIRAIGVFEVRLALELAASTTTEGLQVAAYD